MAIVMPEFQREFVWTLEQSKQLMVSLYRGYPTGGLLFWEARGEDVPEIKNNAVTKDKMGLIKVILDGQQRVTTLYLLINGEIPPYYSEKDISYDPRHLYFNLKTGEFQYYMKQKMENDPLWQKVVDCFNEKKVNAVDIVDLLNGQDVSIDRELLKQVNDNLTNLKSIEKMEYPYQTVPTSARLDEAIDVFDRVNSKGTKLTDAELVLTHITGKWTQARRQLKKKIDQIEIQGFYFNLDFLTRCIVIALTGSALFKKNSKLDYEVFTSDDYIKAWEKVSKSLDYLIPILKQDGLITGSSDMSTLNVMIPIIAYLLANNITLTNSKKYGFLHWMFLALVWARYSGQTDQRLDKDVYLAVNSSNPIDELIDQIEDQRGRLDVKASDLEGRESGHPLYRMLYIVTKYKKAIDWANGGSIYDTIGDNYSIQSHHIFPQSVLYKNGFDPENHLDKKRVNEIANRAFITRDANFNITNRLPEEYLPEVEQKFSGSLSKQFIPIDKDLWKVENYQEFLKTRRELIASAINEYFEYLKNCYLEHNGDTENPNWLELIKKGESDFAEFKSSLRWDYRQNQVNKDLEYVIAKTISAFLNCEGGRLFIGVDDSNQILGLDNDYKTLGNKPNHDGFLLKFDEIVNNYLGKEVHQYLSLNFGDQDGKEFCVVDISSSSFPVFLKKLDGQEFYIRAQASSTPLNMSETMEYTSSKWGK